MTDKKNPIMNKNNDADILRQVANLQAQILKCQNLLKLAPFSEVNIFFYAKEMFCSMDQSMIPFTLSAEIDLLLRESINYYEQKIYDLENELI
jgi:hypothetical protein